MDSLTAPSGVRDSSGFLGAKFMLLPFCSPDFNAIENAFSKLEAMLPVRAEGKIDDLRNVGASCRFTTTECINFKSEYIKRIHGICGSWTTLKGAINWAEACSTLPARN